MLLELVPDGIRTVSDLFTWLCFSVISPSYRVLYQSHTGGTFQMYRGMGGCLGWVGLPYGKQCRWEGTSWAHPSSCKNILNYGTGVDTRYSAHGGIPGKGAGVGYSMGQGRGC